MISAPDPDLQPGRGTTRCHALSREGILELFPRMLTGVCRPARLDALYRRTAAADRSNPWPYPVNPVNPVNPGHRASLNDRHRAPRR